MPDLRKAAFAGRIRVPAAWKRGIADHCSERADAVIGDEQYGLVADDARLRRDRARDRCIRRHRRWPDRRTSVWPISLMHGSSRRVSALTKGMWVWNTASACGKGFVDRERVHRQQRAEFRTVLLNCNTRW